MENMKQHTIWVFTYNNLSGTGREVYGVYNDEDAAEEALTEACNNELFPEYLRIKGVLNDSTSEDEGDYEAWIEPFYEDIDPQKEQHKIQIRY